MATGTEERRFLGLTVFPRRIGVGKLAVFTSIYALLFGMMGMLGFPLTVILVVAIYFAAVGFGQRYLFKGNEPRTASVLVGACFLPCLVFSSYFLQSSSPAHHLAIDYYIRLSLPAAMIGALLGYVFGGVIAGVSLTVDTLTKVRDKLQGAKEPEEEGKGS